MERFDQDVLNANTSRRRFLGLAGGLALTASIGGLLAACGEDDTDGSSDENGSGSASDDESSDATEEETPEPTDEPETGDVESDSDESDAEDAEEQDSDSEEDDESSAETRLIAISTIEPDTLHPYLTQVVLGADIASAVMDSLLQPDDTGVYGPRLAESYEYSDDGLTVTMALRDDVTWQDGEAFTVEDVLAVHETILDPEFGAFNAGGWDQIDEVETPDSHTIIFRLAEVYAPFISAIGDTFIAPKAAIEEGYEHFAEEFGRQPWGTGPYRVEEWQSGEQVRLVANADYWGGTPEIEEIVYRFVPNLNTQMAQLQANEADMTAYATAEQYPEFEDLEGKAIVVIESQAWFHLDLKNYGFLMDRNVRLALDHAVPRQDIVDQILNGQATVSAGDIAPISWAHNPDIEARPYDLDRASELLEEAGWVVGDGGVREKDDERLSIELWGVAGQPQNERVLQVIANSWEQIGVEVDLSVQDANTIWGPDGYQFSETETAGGFTWFNSNDPDHTFYWHSEAIPESPDAPGGNLVGYFNEFEYQDELDELLDRGVATVDQEERREIYYEIQQLLHEEVPVIYVYWEKLIFVVPEELEGFVPNAFSRLFHNVHEWRLQQA